MAASYLSNATGTAEPVGFDPKVSTESKLIKQTVQYIFNMEIIFSKKLFIQCDTVVYLMSVFI